MKVPQWLRKPDWLAELNLVLIFFIVLCAVSAGFTLKDLLTGDSTFVELPVRYVLNPDVRSPGLAAGVTVDVDHEAWVTASIRYPSGAVRALAMLITLPQFLLTVVMFVMLQRTIAAVRRGDPFGPGVGRRLNVLGLTVLFGAVVEWIARGVGGMLLVERISPDDVGLEFLAPNMVWILVAAGFLAVGEIVRRGTAMRAELDEVI